MFPQQGRFLIDRNTCIVTDAANRENAEYLRGFLRPSTGYELPIRTGAADNAIRMAEGAGEIAGLGREGYHLSVHPDGAKIDASTPAGVFHGIQSLRQLLPAGIEQRKSARETTWSIQCVDILDFPRFPWRGFMMDEARHFQGGKEILRLIDLMALQKLNVFHWHLTDDQGWRIEIKRHPRLTELGSTRKGTARGFFGRPDQIAHCGFYTQEEVRRIVAYAQTRHIRIIPEIEMPGHSLAALAAYPELSCIGGPFEVACRFGIFPELYCAGKEEVFAFLRDVLDEVMSLFPSPYLHLGGDETPMARWRKCPHCRDRMKKENLPNVGALKKYFINRIAAHVSSKGRRVIVWNDALHDGLDERAIVHYWFRRRKDFLKAVRGGREALVSSYLDTYLDHPYNLIPLSKAYRFDPVLHGLEGQAADRIHGMEAPLWSEFVGNRRRLDYQAFPRLAAYAETGWTARSAKDTVGFRERLRVFLERLDELGVGYAPLDAVEPSRFKKLFGLSALFGPRDKNAD